MNNTLYRLVIAALLSVNIMIFITIGMMSLPKEHALTTEPLNCIFERRNSGIYMLCPDGTEYLVPVDVNSDYPLKTNTPPLRLGDTG